MPKGKSTSTASTTRSPSATSIAKAKKAKIDDLSTKLTEAIDEALHEHDEKTIRALNTMFTTNQKKLAPHLENMKIQKRFLTAIRRWTEESQGPNVEGFQKIAEECEFEGMSLKDDFFSKSKTKFMEWKIPIKKNTVMKADTDKSEKEKEKAKEKEEEEEVEEEEEEQEEEREKEPQYLILQFWRKTGTIGFLDYRCGVTCETIGYSYEDFSKFNELPVCLLEDENKKLIKAIGLPHKQCEILIQTMFDVSYKS